ncbi:MAG: ion transporter [archaeon]
MANEQWKNKLHEIIYEADTPAGKAFDVIIILAIIASVLAVILDSLSGFNLAHGSLLLGIEWFFTILFTVEYVLRIISIDKPSKYIFSFYGIVDLISFLPTYLSLIFPGLQVLLVIRVLRLLRLFRIFKLGRYVFEAEGLSLALKESFPKISVFLLAVLSIVIIAGAVMYIIEGTASGFDNIPHSIYWAIVTLTTVGYGDLVPRTVWGKVVASMLMILGYCVLAVPTGIVSVEMAKVTRVSTQACPSCGREGHDFSAKFCKYCGESLQDRATAVPIRNYKK